MPNGKISIVSDELFNKQICTIGNKMIGKCRNVDKCDVGKCDIGFVITRV